MWNPITVYVARKLNVVTSLVNTPPVSSSEQKSKKVLVIHCHPNPKSFSRAVSDTVAETLRESGHEVRLRRLYCYENDDELECYQKQSFNPVMSRVEREAYNDETNAELRQTRNGLLEVEATRPDILEAVADLRWCNSIVFVYPTWWFNLPAMLKGYFDRVFLPGVAFNIPNAKNHGNTIPESTPNWKTGRIPGLHHITKIGVVSTYGASRLTYVYVGDNPRRFISRGLRPLFAPQCQLLWHGLYEMDTRTQEDREKFLAEVAEAYRHF